MVVYPVNWSFPPSHKDVQPELWPLQAWPSILHHWFLDAYFVLGLLNDTHSNSAHLNTTVLGTHRILCYMIGTD